MQSSQAQRFQEPISLTLESPKRTFHGTEITPNNIAVPANRPSSGAQIAGANVSWTMPASVAGLTVSNCNPASGSFFGERDSIVSFQVRNKTTGVQPVGSATFTVIVTPYEDNGGTGSLGSLPFESYLAAASLVDATRLASPPGCAIDPNTKDGMTASSTTRIAEGEPVPEGTRIVLTTSDGVVVSRIGTVVRYNNLSNPIVKVVLDDGSHWLAQPWHLKAIPRETHNDKNPPSLAMRLGDSASSSNSVLRSSYSGRVAAHDSTKTDRC